MNDIAQRVAESKCQRAEHIGRRTGRRWGGARIRSVGPTRWTDDIKIVAESRRLQYSAIIVVFQVVFGLADDYLLKRKLEIFLRNCGHWLMALSDPEYNRFWLLVAVFGAFVSFCIVFLTFSYIIFR